MLGLYSHINPVSAIGNSNRAEYVSWNFDVNHLSEGLFELTFKALIDDDCYIYAQKNDGEVSNSLRFRLVPNENVENVGGITEEGQNISYDSEAKAYKAYQQVVYKTKIEVKQPNTKAIINVQYQACSKTNCVPSSYDFELFVHSLQPDVFNK